MSHGRRRTGFTLLEMVVSLALVTLLLALTAGLMNQIRLVFLREQRLVHESPPQQALQLLRHDLHGAVQVDPPSDIWSSGPMALAAADGGIVIWTHGTGGLQRTLADAGGESVSRRRLPAGFSGWRWRNVSDGLVEVELTVARRPPAAGRLTGSAPWRDTPAGSRTLRLRLALRGALRGTTW